MASSRLDIHPDTLEIYKNALLKTSRDDTIFTPLRGARSTQLVMPALFKKVSEPYLVYNQRNDEEYTKALAGGLDDCLYLSQVVRIGSSQKPDTNTLFEHTPDVLKRVKEGWIRDKNRNDILIQHQIYGAAPNWFVQYYVMADIEYAIAADQSLSEKEVKETKEVQTFSHEGLAAIRLYRDRTLKDPDIFESIIKTGEGIPLVSLHALAQTGTNDFSMLQSVDGGCNPQKRFTEQLKAIATFGNSRLAYEKCIEKDGTLGRMRHFTCDGIPIDGPGLLQTEKGYYRFLEHLGIREMEGVRRFVILEKGDFFSGDKARGLYIACFDPAVGYKALFDKSIDPNPFAHHDHVLANGLNVAVCLAIPLPVLLYEMASFTRQCMLSENPGVNLKSLDLVIDSLRSERDVALAKTPDLADQFKDAVRNERERFENKNHPSLGAPPSKRV